MSREADGVAALGRPVLDALRSWERAGLVTALQRPPTPEPGGDVDVLVSPSDLTRAEAMLSSAGWLLAPSTGYGSHRFWVLRDAESDEWHHLDVVSTLDYGPTLAFRTDLAPACLARRVRKDGLPCLHQDDTFWLTVLHQAWKADTDARRSRLVRASEEVRVDGPVAQFLADRTVHGTAGLEALLRSVRDEDWPAVLAAVHQVRRRWSRAERREILTRHTRNYALQRLPVARQPGVAVALLGLDGAGKTTVGKRLRAEAPWPTVWLYMGVWKDSRLDQLLEPVIGGRLVLRLGRLARVGAVTRYHRRMGRVVVLDRYIVDATLPSPDLDWKGRVSSVLVLRTAPAPDRLVLLDAPADVVFARKGELTLPELRDRREHYRRLVRRSPRWTTVDATQPLDDVVAEVADIVWQDLLAARRSAEQPVVGQRGVTPQREVAVLGEDLGEVPRQRGLSG